LTGLNKLKHLTIEGNMIKDVPALPNIDMIELLEKCDLKQKPVGYNTMNSAQQSQTIKSMTARDIINYSIIIIIVVAFIYFLHRRRGRYNYKQ
jgi:hypothetical protein